MVAPLQLSWLALVLSIVIVPSVANVYADGRPGRSRSRGRRQCGTPDASQPPVAWMFDATIVVTPASSVADELSAVNEIDACPPGSSVSPGTSRAASTSRRSRARQCRYRCPNPPRSSTRTPQSRPWQGRRQPRPATSFFFQVKRFMRLCPCRVDQLFKDAGFATALPTRPRRPDTRPVGSRARPHFGSGLPVWMPCLLSGSGGAGIAPPAKPVHLIALEVPQRNSLSRAPPLPALGMRDFAVATQREQ